MAEIQFQRACLQSVHLLINRSYLHLHLRALESADAAINPDEHMIQEKSEVRSSCMVLSSLHCDGPAGMLLERNCSISLGITTSILTRLYSITRSVALSTTLHDSLLFSDAKIVHARCP
jgi:hypothetical protein